MNYNIKKNLSLNQLKNNYKQKIINQVEKINNINKMNTFKLKNSGFKLKEKYNSIIPKNTFTCWHTKDLPPKMLENYNKMKEENPEFNHYLFDEDDCRKFISENFDETILNAYNSLIPCAYKSDLWRYCVLYKYGGIYFDIKYRTVNGFKLLALTEKEYFVRDAPTSFNGVYNALIVTLPRNEIMLNCINKIVSNVNNKYYGNNCLEPTGPVLLGSFFSQQQKNELELYLEVCKIPNVIDTFYICYGNNIILGRYKGYYDEQKIYKKTQRYCDLWERRNIY
jgi:mannosyltransferase OCH1-like enzyme